jgi:ubiquinone biosynthesis protein Coq4
MNRRAQLQRDSHWVDVSDLDSAVAGCKKTSSNEIAISAFRIAQFGHNYSGMFLAAVYTRVPGQR